MRLPQYTLRDMFLATTLIAFGIGILTWAVFRPTHDFTPIPAFAILFTATSLIGAGIGTLFHEKAVGAFFAIVVVILGTIVFLLLSPAVKGVT